MSNHLIIIDTSVFLNILSVPGKCQDKEEVIKAFEDYIALGASFILPMATIIETGNHIAQNGNGNTRRKVASQFCEHISKVLNDEAPYKISNFPNNDEMKQWLNQFPDLAMRNKSPTKQEGTSFGDLTIIQEFEKQKKLFRAYEIWIWSLDDDLKQCNY